MLLFQLLKQQIVLPCMMLANIPKGLSSQFFTRAMTFIMGIVTMARLTHNMPKKLTDAIIYTSPIYCADTMFIGQVPLHQFSEPAISGAEYMPVLKLMAGLEEKVSGLSMKPAGMPAEKEEMLNATISQVDSLELDLMATKKVHL